MIAIPATKPREGRAWARRAAMLALFLLPSCLPARQVTVGETQVGQGLLYQSSNPTYDRFFEETHALQLSAMNAPDEETKARASLEQALIATKTTPEQLAELAKTRAKKLDGSPLRLSATGLPREKSGDKAAHVTAALSVSDDATLAASEKDFVKSLEQTVLAEAELVDKFSPIAAKARTLSARSSELLGSVNTDFTVESRRSEVSEELGAAKLILDAVADRSASVAAGAISFLKIMADALPPPGPPSTPAAKADAPKAKPKKNGTKPPPATPKPKPEPAPKPKPEAPSKPKPEPIAASAKPAPPAPKPAPVPVSKPADDFNP